MSRFASANQRTRADLADGSYWVYQYDTLGQVVSGKHYWSDVTVMAGQDFDYKFDDIGNPETTGGRASAVNDYTANQFTQYTTRTVANPNAGVQVWKDADSPASTGQRHLPRPPLSAGDTIRRPTNATTPPAMPNLHHPLLHYSSCWKCPLAFLGVLGIVGCDTSPGNEFNLVRWSDGPTDRYAIEIRQRNGADVIIPDVRALQTNDRFVSGFAYWNYIDGLNMPSNSLLSTNRFWFIIDKESSHRKYSAILSTNLESWVAWCHSNSAPTNLIETSEFLDARRLSGEERSL